MRTATFAFFGAAAFALLCYLGGKASADFFPMDSSQFEHKFEGDVAPPPGYTPLGFPDGGEIGGTTDGDIYSLDHNTVSTRYESDPWAMEADDAGGWTGEIRFQLDPTVVDEFQLQWRIGDGENTADNPQKIYRFFGNSVLALNPTMELVADADLTSGFHTFRVAQMAGDNEFHQWLDGVPLTPTTGGYSGASTMWWGSGSGGTSGVVQVDYVRWTGEGGYAPIPEPATYALLICALFGIALATRSSWMPIS